MSARAARRSWLAGMIVGAVAFPATGAWAERAPRPADLVILQERQTMQSDLDALSRESCLFQDVTDFGLGAAAVIGRPHAKRAVHRVGQISNGKDCHDFISWKIRQ